MSRAERLCKSSRPAFAIFGQIVHWPTIITLVLFIIVAVYFRLALKEEKELINKFGDQYRAYQRSVPMFLPRWGQWHGLLTALGHNEGADSDEDHRRPGAA